MAQRQPITPEGPNTRAAAAPELRRARADRPGTRSPRRVPPAPASRDDDAEFLGALTDAQCGALLDRRRLVEDWLATRDAAAQRGRPAGLALRAFMLSSTPASSARTLRRWTAAYASDGLGGLAETRGRPSNSDGAGCDPDAWDHFKLLYLDDRRRSLKLCWELTAHEACGQGWTWPTYHAVVRRVRAELPPFQANYFRLGERRWMAKYAPRIQRDYSRYRPMELLVGDHHEFDLVVLAGGKPVRPWLTAWMDMRSRYFVGWWIDLVPAADTILAALRAAIVEHGAPLEMLVDNGKDYRAACLAGGRRYKPRLDQHNVVSICARLGIVPHFSRVYAPQSKPIESNFKTVCQRFSKLFDSYCGASPDTRPEHFYADLRAGAVDVPGIERFRELFGQWLSDVHHRTPHTGDSMDGRTPLDVFNDNPIAKRTAPRAVLDFLLMRTERVKVSKNGVRYRGQHYGQGRPELLPLIGRDVLIKVDPTDAGYVFVCDLAGRKLTTARNERLRGLSPDDVAEGARRQTRARKLAKAALPAMRAARKTTAEHAIAAQAERLVPLRQAAGGETATNCDAAARPLAPLPGASELAAALRPAGAGDLGATLRAFAGDDECDDDDAPPSELRSPVFSLDLDDDADELDPPSVLGVLGDDDG